VFEEAEIGEEILTAEGDEGDEVIRRSKKLLLRQSLCPQRPHGYFFRRKADIDH
jgi:hypothetical protein